MEKTRESLYNLLSLFNCSSKKELKKCEKTIVISKKDLVDLILISQNGLLASYSYANYFDRRIPEHLIPKTEELEALHNNGIGEFKTLNAKKFSRKIFQLHKEQRTIAVHLFYTHNFKYWHLFYFDNKDKVAHQNHWKEGSHIHYISDLLTESSLEEVWKKIKKGKWNFSNKLHLRYLAS